MEWSEVTLGAPEGWSSGHSTANASVLIHSGSHALLEGRCLRDGAAAAASVFPPLSACSPQLCEGISIILSLAHKILAIRLIPPRWMDTYFLQTRTYEDDESWTVLSGDYEMEEF